MIEAITILIPDANLYWNNLSSVGMALKVRMSETETEE